MKPLTLNRNNTMLFAYALNLADLLFTNLWVALAGVQAESNPIGTALYNSGLADFFKIVVVGGAMYFLHKTQCKTAQRLVLAVYLAILGLHIVTALSVGAIFLKII